jgi:hypothetical protein
VSKRYNHDEEIDYKEIYAFVVRLKAIILILAYAKLLDFKLYQMVVKSDFSE